MPAVTDKQEQIMKASLELFIERGFDGTTMPMISKKSKRRSGHHLPLFRQQGGTRQYFVPAQPLSIYRKNEHKQSRSKVKYSGVL
ncbi:hypothetical protein BsIDN1_33170 [Bacillus safensis]|uniref:HTH tetR-type domain-containing protein n=1 Tax=Bacillus safensis TaxID=561879 RepID=A0A5S9MCM2_BACIA|nr:hypothetical protein BsIDN1_33170 [Bacillus safensis]